MWDWDIIDLPISEISLQPVAIPLLETMATSSIILKLISSKTSPLVQTLSQHSPTIPILKRGRNPTIPNHQEL